MRVGGDLVDLGVHRAEHVFLDDFEAAVEVEGGGDRFVDGGGQRAGHRGAGLDAFAGDEQVGEAGFVGDFGAGAAGDDGGFDLGQVALEVFGEAAIEGFADDQV